ncbi:MAG: MnmC family methyltransferase [Bdellovibrionaceae bacterium]|nr:MnmC family methyltransferase [Pseudobdellovibrionaceae bacterium]MDW8189911.1 MnmC family methyltransferase [Pseudobdellovibrionaceae bacterium]
MFLTNLFDQSFDFQARAWSDLGWEAVRTDDGSWSLRDLSGPSQELMHHRWGAYSETEYVISRVLPDVFKYVCDPFILNLGLGLGYNELRLATVAFQNKKSIAGITFEKDLMLLRLFAHTLMGHTRGADAGIVPDPFKMVYRDVFSLHPVEGLEFFLSLLLGQQWQLHGALNLRQLYEELRGKVHLFVWDPFSPKTSPELWVEEDLVHFLSWTAHPQYSWFTTYACNGVLKRALKRAGFHVVVMPGFGSKKHSLIGFRQ